MFNARGLFLIGIAEELCLGTSTEELLHRRANFDSVFELQWCKAFDLSFEDLVWEANDIAQAFASQGRTRINMEARHLLVEGRTALCQSLLDTAKEMQYDIRRLIENPMLTIDHMWEYREKVWDLGGNYSFVYGLAYDMAMEGLRFEATIMGE